MVKSPIKCNKKSDINKIETYNAKNKNNHIL